MNTKPSSEMAGSNVADYSIGRYALLMAGQLLSLFGSHVVTFSFAVWVFQLTGSVVEMALLSVCAILPIVLVSPFAGVIADRAPRKFTLIAADTTLAIVSLIVLFLSLSDLLQPWHLYITAVLGGLASGLQRPLFESLTPLMVPEDKLVKVNGAVQTVAGISQLLSPALAGALVLSVGLSTVLVLDLMTFVIAMGTLLIVTIPNTKSTEIKNISWKEDIKSGFQYVFQRAGLRSLFLFVTIRNFAFAVCEVLALPLLLTLTTADKAGLILSLSGLGIVVGGGLTVLTGGFKRKIDSVFIAQLLTAIAMIIAAITTNLWILGLAVALAFVAFPVEESTSTSIMQAKVPGEYMGRVSAARQMMTLSAVPVAMLISAPMAEYVFEPWLVGGDGFLRNIAMQVVGEGKGRGMAVMLLVMGVLLSIVTILARFYKPLVNVEEDLRDEKISASNETSSTTSRDNETNNQKPARIFKPVKRPGNSIMSLFERRPYLLSIAMLFLVTVWMLAPMADEDNDSKNDSNTEKLQLVQVTELAKEPLTLSLGFTGQTRASATAKISAELDALLQRFHVERGEAIKTGEALATLSTGSLATALQGAKAERYRAQLTYNVESRLAKKGVTTELAKAAAYATLQATKAQVDQIQKELQKSSIVAPFDGIIARKYIEQGDFVNLGQPILQLISVNPLVAAGNVSERDVSSLTIGDPAKVKVVGKEDITGSVSYISPIADEATRTFEVEVTFPNDNLNMAVGMTAQIVISLDTTFAHKLSPALLTLNAVGDIEVATVDETDVVRLNTVNILHSEANGVWVSGVPENARVITLGQGFVREGEKVNPATAPNSSAEEMIADDYEASKL